MGESPKSPTVIHEDDQRAIAIAKNLGGYARTKHIDIRYHFTREAVQTEAIVFKYILSDEMIADILTKSLPQCRFQELVHKLGMKHANTNRQSGSVVILTLFDACHLSFIH